MEHIQKDSASRKIILPGKLNAKLLFYRCPEFLGGSFRDIIDCLVKYLMEKMAYRYLSLSIMKQKFPGAIFFLSVL